MKVFNLVKNRYLIIELKINEINLTYWLYKYFKNLF